MGPMIVTVSITKGFAGHLGKKKVEPHTWPAGHKMFTTGFHEFFYAQCESTKRCTCL